MAPPCREEQDPRPGPPASPGPDEGSPHPQRFEGGKESAIKLTYFGRAAPSPPRTTPAPGSAARGGGRREPVPGRRCRAAGEALGAHAQAAPRSPRPVGQQPRPRGLRRTRRGGSARPTAPLHPPERPAQSPPEHPRTRSYLLAGTWRRRAPGARRSPAQRGGRRGSAARRCEGR